MNMPRILAGLPAGSSSRASPPWPSAWPSAPAAPPTKPAAAATSAADPRRRRLERPGVRHGRLAQRVPEGQLQRHRELRPVRLGCRRREVQRRRHRLRRLRLGARTPTRARSTRPRSAAAADAIEVPNYVSPIAVVYNVQGVEDLQLSAKTIAQIFDGKITKWNDAAIAAENHGAKLPSTTISPVHRSDESGTTENFTDYLEQAGEGAWTPPDGQGVADQERRGRQRHLGRRRRGHQGDGSIGYADFSQAGDLGSATIKVGDGYVAPSAEAAAKVARGVPAGRRSPGRRHRDRRRPHHHRVGCLPAAAGVVPDRLPDLRRRERRPTSSRVSSATSSRAEGQQAARRQRRLRPAPASLAGRRPRTSSRTITTSDVLEVRWPIRGHRTRAQFRGAPCPTSTATRGRSPGAAWVTVLFSGIARAAGLSILLALAGVGVFLIVEGSPGVHREPSGPLRTPRTSSPTSGRWSSARCWPPSLALLIADPAGASAWRSSISHYAPRRLAAPLGYLVDLLAAVPSVVYGLWGIGFLGAARCAALRLARRSTWACCRSSPARPRHRTHDPHRGHRARDHGPADHHRDLPRDLPQTPRLHEEAALALGATRWEMIRLAVLPYARSGIVSAVMLGLGRALGETMAVAMVLSASGVVTFNLISSTNPSTIAANIALTSPTPPASRSTCSSPPAWCCS